MANFTSVVAHSFLFLENARIICDLMYKNNTSSLFENAHDLDDKKNENRN